MTTNDDDIDALLKHRELDPPVEFTHNLMASIEREIETTNDEKYSLSDVMQWLALGLGGIYGMGQSLYFLLGIWFVTSTG